MEYGLPVPFTQLMHNVSNFGTFIRILWSDIYQSVYFLAVTRSLVCGNLFTFCRTPNSLPGLRLWTPLGDFRPADPCNTVAP